MNRPRMAAVITAIGLTLAMTSTARAGGPSATLQTPSLIPDPDGYLYCRVIATSKTAMGLVADILTDKGTSVTEFGSSWRVSPEATGDGRWYAEETAGSFADAGRSCRVTVTGARKRDVQVSLTSFDTDGNVIATVEAR